MKAVNLKINDRTIQYQLDGDTCVGKNEILLEQDDNLIAGQPWEKRGYEVFPFIEEDHYNALRNGIASSIQKITAEVTGSDLVEFDIEAYHNYVNDDQQLAFAKVIKDGFLRDEMPIDMQIIIDRIQDILGMELVANPPDIPEKFFFRIVRPGTDRDFNLPHRDVYLDRLRNGVNIYVPLFGSNTLSSLPMLPGSHILPEKVIERTAEGALVNGVKFTVPCITAVEGELELIRPETGWNEVLLFSPYLVHGGGFNFNEDQTRVSLEMRFWRK